MKKIFFICLIFILFCGCTAEVDMVVTTNQKVEEKIKIAIAQHHILAYSSLNEFKQNYRNILDGYDKNYSLNVYSKGDTITSIVKNKDQIDSLGVEGMSILLFQKIEKKERSYVLKFSDQVKDLLQPNLEMEIEEEELLKEIKIHIQFHNVIENANSDSYNSKSNTYTWIMNKDNLDRNIEFTIAKEKRYDIIIPYLIKKYFDLILLGVLVVIVFVVSLFIIRKAKRENAI